MQTNLTIAPKNKKRELNICGGQLAERVDCSDPEMMIRTGIHPPRFVLDQNVFKKTDTEKERLKTLRRIQGLANTKFLYRSLHEFDPINKLIIHIKNEKKEKDFKTTFRYNCKSSEIVDILKVKHEKDNILSLSFNGVKL